MWFVFCVLAQLTLRQGLLIHSRLALRQSLSWLMRDLTHNEGVLLGLSFIARLAVESFGSLTTCLATKSSGSGATCLTTKSYLVCHSYLLLQLTSRWYPVCNPFATCPKLYVLVRFVVWLLS